MLLVHEQVQDDVAADRSADSQLRLQSLRYLPRGGSRASDTSGSTGALADITRLHTSHVAVPTRFRISHSTHSRCF